MPWDLAWPLAVAGGSRRQFAGQEILGARSAPRLWETARGLLDARRASLMFLPRKPNFACPNAAL